MKQDGMGPFHTVGIQKVRQRKCEAQNLPPADRARLEGEASRRFATLSPETQPAPSTLSRVEQAMRRNAPDLAGGTPEEVAAAKARRRAHHDAKWPRPRLAALVMLMASATANPLPVLRLGVWGVVLFLAVSVAVGPERARDYSAALWRAFVGLWKHEIVVLRKAIQHLRDRIDSWLRTAL
ncbi:hypothetical protein [Shimia aestuarii]|uniref:hypothetical protein n=1 Tax=Shimia aestuarii TaxID=254406 RepID=UPI001FB2CFE1|nr:hypothetical protein [Shimia aestuarii]